jgi:hypothetical protein
MAAETSIGALDYGDTAAREVSKRYLGAVATTAILQTVTLVHRYTGMLAVVTADNSIWMYDADSTAAASASVLLPDDSPAAGRWIAKDLSLTLSDATPAASTGAGTAGVSSNVSRTDHAHPGIQSGTLTLVAGTKTVATGIVITSSSRIFFTRTTANTCSLTANGYAVTNKTTGGSGTGAFTVIACVADGTINVADISTLDYLIIN